MGSTENPEDGAAVRRYLPPIFPLPFRFTHMINVVFRLQASVTRLRLSTLC